LIFNSSSITLIPPNINKLHYKFLFVDFKYYTITSSKINKYNISAIRVHPKEKEQSLAERAKDLEPEEQVDKKTTLRYIYNPNTEQ